MRVAIIFIVTSALAMAACDDGADPPPHLVREAVEEPAAAADHVSEYEPEQEDIAALTAMLAPEYADFREDFPDSLWLPAFRAAAFDLDGDGVDEMLLRLDGRLDCGSGGCAFRVYRKEPRGFRKVSGTTVTFLPIAVSDRTSHGWRDIVVGQRKDHVPSGKARLSYEGGTYPLNPSVPPALPTDEVGRIVLSEETLLHPLVD